MIVEWSIEATALQFSYRYSWCQEKNEIKKLLQKLSQKQPLSLVKQNYNIAFHYRKDNA